MFTRVRGAVANAVADAIGVRITDLPITPEKVLRALGKIPKDSAGPGTTTCGVIGGDRAK